MCLCVCVCVGGGGGVEGWGVEGGHKATRICTRTHILCHSHTYPEKVKHYLFFPLQPTAVELHLEKQVVFNNASYT